MNCAICRGRITDDKWEPAAIHDNVFSLATSGTTQAAVCYPCIEQGDKAIRQEYATWIWDELALEPLEEWS